MATIGEEIPVSLGKVTTNVTDSTEVFYNRIHQNYPTGTQFREGYSIYEQTDSDIIVSAYNSLDEDTYTIGQLIFKDNKVQKVYAHQDVNDTVAKQPEDYTSFDTSYYQSDWQNRYMKFLDINEDDSFTGNKLHINETDGIDMYMSPDGTRLFTYDNTTLRIYQYNLSTPHDISTASYSGLSAVVGKDKNYTYFCVSENGLHIYCGTEFVMSQIDLSTAWELSNYSEIDSINVETELYNFLLNSSQPIRSIDISNDGTKIFVIETYGIFHTFTLSTPYDITSATLTRSANYHRIDWKPISVRFGNSGSYLYVTYYDGRILRLEFSTPYNTSTSTASSYTNLFTRFPIPVWTNSGNSLFIYDMYDSFIYQFNPSASWVATNAVYSIFPATVTVGGNTYTITRNDDNTYEFSSESYSGEIVSYAPMDVYSYVTATTNEPKAFIGSNSLWVGKTLIIRPDALYIRTTIDEPIEYETITTPKYAIVNFITDISEFDRLTYANPYKPFDGRNITPATSSSPMEYKVECESAFNAFTLSKVLGNSVAYKFTLPSTDSNYSLWLDGVEVESEGNGVVKTAISELNCARDCNSILSEYPTTRIFYSDYQMPVGSTVDVIISRTNGNVELGDLTLNNSIPNGMTNLEFNHSYQDYNTYTPDAFGEIQEGTKPITVKFNITTDVLLENYDLCVAFHNSIAGKFVTIDGSDSKGQQTDGKTIFNSMTKRVLITSSSHKSIVKDGDLWKMAQLQLTALEII